MRASLSKIALIDKFIFQKGLMSQSEKVLLESYRILEPEFELEIENQKKSIRLILKSGRRKLREEIADVHYELFHTNSKSDFKTAVRQLFQK